jgi:hypothetical protein
MDAMFGGDLRDHLLLFENFPHDLRFEADGVVGAFSHRSHLPAP